MTVIQDCMCGSVGEQLGDVEVCEMLETVLTTCCQMRLSGGLSRPLLETTHHVLTGVMLRKEILRRSAEATMHALVKTAFARLYVLNPEEEERKLAEYDATGQDGEAKMSVTAHISEHPETPSLPEESTTAVEASNTSETVPSSATDVATSLNGSRPRCV